MNKILALPLFVILMGIGALAMLVPSFHALFISEFETSRLFFYGALLFSILTVFVALATVSYAPRSAARSHLTTLFASFTALPIMLATPFWLSVPGLTFFQAWFEMVSSITTTGATLFYDPDMLNSAQHLWRAEVAWLGGFLVWVAALAILAPLNMGGFEVRSRSDTEYNLADSHLTRFVSPSDRLVRAMVDLAPIYGGLTLALWILMVLAGDPSIVALSHAMSIVSTSGISPIGGLSHSEGGLVTEMIVAVFFIFALSRLTFSQSLPGETRRTVWDDPELRLGLGIGLSATVIIFSRHFVSDSPEVSQGFVAAITAFWGELFTVFSFLTTTGFESLYWEGSQVWSGANGLGFTLVGLALIGGGIATTAGGVKLLRVYALLRHSQREIERLVHPNSVGGAGQEARLVRRQGAFVAWIFFMLFVFSVASVLVLLTLSGTEFEVALTMAVAGFSTTGPLLNHVTDFPILLDQLSPLTQLIFAASMVLGRLEAMVLIALLNPEFWRD